MCSQKTMDKIDRGSMVALPTWLGIFRIINPIAFLGFIFYLGSYKTEIENRTFGSPQERDAIIHQVESNKRHAEDMRLHMPFEKKIEVFVPRAEVNYKFEVVVDNQKKIMKKLNIN